MTEVHVLLVWITKEAYQRSIGVNQAKQFVFTHFMCDSFRVILSSFSSQYMMKISKSDMFLTRILNKRVNYKTTVTKMCVMVCAVN